MISNKNIYHTVSMNKLIIVTILSTVSLVAIAQKDTTKTQTIDITSSFKPVLRNAVKINLYGTQLPADTSRPALSYNIPSQNLFYAYQPITLRPLALQQDTNLYLGGRNFVKAGFGSLSTPFLSAGISLGDGRKSLINFYGDYIGSKGSDIKYQDYSMLNVKATASAFTKNNEIYGAATLRRDDYNLYGYDHVLHNYEKKDIRQQMQDVGLVVGIRNTGVNNVGVNYNPSVQLNFFNNKNKVNETTITALIPVEKKWGDDFNFKVALKAEIANYATQSQALIDTNFNNNLIQLMPAIEYKTDIIKLHGGFTPVWNNGDFSWIPNVYAEARLAENLFLLQAGWVGRFVQNTYRNLISQNPYLLPISLINNTKEVEFYGGLKASIAKHFNVSAKAGLVRYTDLPLFVNDVDNDEKGFLVSNESKINNFRIHGDISYINQEKFNLTAGLTFNGYTGMKDNDKAWHRVPMEFNASLRWWPLKNLMLKSDMFIYNGGKYLMPGGDAGTLPGAADLSAGAEFRINKQFSAWFDVNNILNDKYERWHNYQVYGLNFLGGIKINF